MEQSPFKAATEGLVDAIYSRFLLRDMVGKVVPGSILLFAIIGSYLEKSDVKHVIQHTGFFAALVLFSLAWVTAFSIQSFGEYFNLIRYFPKKTKIDEKPDESNINIDKNPDKYQDDKIRFKRYYQKIILFNKHATPLERMERERLLVIRESCGNTYVSLIFSFIVYISAYGVKNKFSTDINTDIFNHTGHFLPVIVSIFPAILCLRYMHNQYVERHSVYLNTILSLNNISVDKIEDEFVMSTFNNIYTSLKEGSGLSAYSLAKINFESNCFLNKISINGIVGAAKFDYELANECKRPRKLHLSKFDLIKRESEKDPISGSAHLVLVESNTIKYEFCMVIELDDKNCINKVTLSDYKGKEISSEEP